MLVEVTTITSALCTRLDRKVHGCAHTRTVCQPVDESVLHYELDQSQTSQVRGAMVPHQHDQSHMSKSQGHVTRPNAFVSNAKVQQPQHGFYCLCQPQRGLLYLIPGSNCSNTASGSEVGRFWVAMLHQSACAHHIDDIPVCIRRHECHQTGWKSTLVHLCRPEHRFIVVVSVALQRTG